MKKIISVNIGNSIFQMEDDAYMYLNSVLHAHRENRNLETEAAELLSQKLSGAKQVITYPDVAEALYRLGISAPINDQTNVSKPARRLYRQPANKMIAGICTGLGEYFDIDPVIARIIFIAMFFGWGSGLLIYIVLWIIVPKAPKLLNS